MRIFVAGSTGMVGRNICENKFAQNHQILSPNKSQLDLTDRTKLRIWLFNNQPDLIINAAGLVGGIHANIANPSKFLIRNLDIGVNLVSEAAHAGIKNFINLGSSCMYPRDAPNPLNENSLLTGRLEPTNEGYALAKIAIQRLCTYYSEQDQSFKYITLMPCNLYGKYDHFEPSRSHLIASIIVKLHNAKINNQKSVLIWGDGTVKREFMYVEDLANAIWSVLPKLNELPKLINVGPGYDRDIFSYYKEAAKVVGYEGEFKFDLSRPVGMRQKLLDVKTIHELGWSPLFQLKKGLQLTYDYYLGLLKKSPSF